MITQLEGYLSQGTRKPVPCLLVAEVRGPGMQETLTLSLPGGKYAAMPVRPLERLVAEVRKLPQDRPVERCELVGGYRNIGTARQQASFRIWVSRNRGTDTLTVELSRDCQVSLLYQPVERILADSRRSLV